MMQVANNTLIKTSAYEEFLATVAESIVLPLSVDEQRRGLVGIIGDGYERNNRQALISWIARSWDYTSVPNAREATETLSDELVEIIEDFT